MGRFSTKNRFKDGGDFLVPEGVYTGKLAAIIDLGEVETAFGMKEKVLFYFVLDQDNEGGEPLSVRSSYNWVLNPKSNLFEMVSKLLGKKKLSPEDVEDLEVCLGKIADLNIVHSEPTADGKVFANIDAVLKARGTGRDLAGYVLPKYFVDKYGEDAISLAEGVEFPDEEDARPKMAPKKAASAKAAPKASGKDRQVPASEVENDEDEDEDEGEDDDQGEESAQEVAPPPAPAAKTGRPARPRAFGNRG